MRYIFHLIFVFIFIFAPKVPVLYNGTFVAGLIATFIIIINKNSQKRFIYLIRKKYTLLIISFPILISIISVFVTSVHNEYDFSIIKTFINQSISLFIVVEIVSIIIREKDRNALYIHKLIIDVFIIQTIIMLIAFFYSDFLRFVQIFQSEDIISRAHTRGGIRTLMLATTAYFGLGISYGFIYFIYFRNIITNQFTKVYNTLILSLLIIGTLFVARTGLVGFLMSVLFFYISYISYKIKFKFSLNIFLFIIVLLASILLIIPETVIEPFRKNVIPFAFEMFQNDGFQTNSTNQLAEMWKIDLNVKTFFLGDGKYLNNDGSYYKQTDVGYLRNILFGGIFFFLLLLIYQMYMLLIPFRKKGKISKNDKLFFIIIVSFLLITHAKGEVIGFSKTLIISIFLYLLPIYFYNRKNENFTNNK